MQLSVRVMAHPSREEWAHQVAEKTGALIVWDEIGSAWDTGKRALLSGVGTHVMVLQDDILVSDGLVESVSAAIEYSEDHPIGLYVTDGPKPQAALAHEPDPWWLHTGPIWGPGVVIPTEHVEALVKWADHKPGKSYDIRLWQWYFHQGILCLYTNPCLVDHRQGHASLMHKGRPMRHAPNFGSGLGLDWSKPPLVLDGQQLFPKVWMERTGVRKMVRKGTKEWRSLKTKGFIEAPE